MFSNRKAEIPSVNLLKLHGSITWKTDVLEGGIVYQQYKTAIHEFRKKYSELFDEKIASKIASHFTADQVCDAIGQIQSLIAGTLLNDLLDKEKEYGEFIQKYKWTFLIVNPTKEKFSDTLLNKNYYEILRIFSNELEKENSLLVVNGFSFRDEHILDLLKRSMLNPSLKILIFAYKEKEIANFQSLFGTLKNNNISYITLDGEALSLKYFNQILGNIHS